MGFTFHYRFTISKKTWQKNNKKIGTDQLQLSWGKLRREPATRWFDKSFAPTLASEERFARQYQTRASTRVSSGLAPTPA